MTHESLVSRGQTQGQWSMAIIGEDYRQNGEGELSIWLSKD